MSENQYEVGYQGEKGLDWGVNPWSRSTLITSQVELGYKREFVEAVLDMVDVANGEAIRLSTMRFVRVKK